MRAVVNSRLPRGYQEGMLYGMIGWYIPLADYPATYNRQPLCLAGLAAQKQHNALYMMTVYGDKRVEERFKAGFKAAGKKLDMGKSCVRFKAADSLALDVIADTISKVSTEAYIAAYELARGAIPAGAKRQVAAKARKPASKKPATKKPATKKPVAKKKR